MKKYIRGTTFKTTWISSGVTASPIGSVLYTGSETVVDSVSMQDSGNGHYFALHTMPTSLDGFYVSEVRATVNSRLYLFRQYLEAISMEAD